MLAVRVIPVLLKRGAALVKGQHFNPWRSVGVALQAAKIHAGRGVDELLILDVDATPSGRGPDFDAIKELTQDCFCPLTVGGGVRTVEDVRRLLAAGADKVAIGAASRDTSIIREASDKFGSQAIVAIIDHDNNHRVSKQTTALSAAIEMQYWGAGEIILQSRDRDGTMQGYDLDLIEIVSDAVSVPVVACGGCSGPNDMLHAVLAGASGCAAGALFAFSDITPRQCAEYLLSHNVEARLPA